MSGRLLHLCALNMQQQRIDMRAFHSNWPTGSNYPGIRSGANR